ncbi:hypothetical protein AB7M63_003596 [Bradyrhizobium japonicum]
MYQKVFVLLRTYAALATFLASYFALTVVGNLLYFTPFGGGIGRVQIADFSISNFQTAGSFGYWALLFLPFVVAPPIVFAVKRILAPMAPYIRTIKISTPAYLVALATCYAYASVSLWRANASGLFLRGNDAVDSVYDRFELLSSLGFWPLVTIKSLLVALSCYGLIVAIETRKPLWLLVAGTNVVAMTVILTMLIMKWPLVLFYFAQIFAIVLFAKRPLFPAIGFSALALTSYLLISMVLLRAEIVTKVFEQPSTARTTEDRQSGQKPPAAPTSGVLTSLMAAPLNRMAQPFLYYVETFTREGQICGTLLDRLERKSTPCHPSTLVYSRMFSDRFAGIGTAPQSAHVTGYALNGMIGAVVELALTSIVLGLFAAIATVHTPAANTVTVLGALTGYFFSQLPFEGPIVYDHGALWWAALLLLLAAPNFRKKAT